MGARTYAPQLGRFLQTDPIPGGSANAYAYTYGDPVNSNDLTGERAGKGLSAWALKDADEISRQEVAAYETALREEAERKAREAAEQARTYAAITTGTPQGENYEEEWWRRRMVGRRRRRIRRLPPRRWARSAHRRSSTNPATRRRDGKGGLGR